jgi:hypothetical protein
MTSFLVIDLTEQVVTMTYSVSTFDTYISWWLDGERISGFIHLPVVVGEHRGCSLLLVVSIELGSWRFPQVVA